MPHTLYNNTDWYKFAVVYCESVNLIGYIIVCYLTIRLFALDFYRVIVDEGAARVNYPAICARVNYHAIEMESE